MFDEANDLGAGEGGGDPMQVSVGIGGHGGNSRQLWPVAAVAEDRGLPTLRPGSARRGQQGETAFVHKHQSDLQGLGFFSIPQSGTSLLDPALDGWFVALAGATGGFLPAPTEAMQQAADVVAVIAHAETLPEQIGDPLGGPDRRGEPVGLGSARQQVGELSQLRAGQLGWAT